MTFDAVPGHAFDGVADAYDRAFTRTRLGRWLRNAVWEQLAASFDAESRVLELGCGTGEDALWLAGRGVQVVATDASAAMLDVASRKAAEAGVAERVRFLQLDLEDPGNADRILGAPFDGALSNFGALNCLAERRPFAQALGRWLRPGGRVVLVVMGPVCPWEIAWHLLHGEVGVAFRRFRSGTVAHVGGGRTLRVWYPSPRRLRADLASDFRHLGTVGIGTLLPPSHLGHLAERWPGLFAALATLDRRLGGTFPWTWLNDHYVMILERR